MKVRRLRLFPSVCEGLAAIFFVVALLLSAQAAQAPGKSEKATKGSGGSGFSANTKDPIFITSDKMEMDRQKNTLIYKGRVVAVQADMTMNSETLTAYIDPDIKQLKEVVAEGKVKVVQGNRVATGARAVFDQKNQTIVLTGDPVVRQGNSQVSGDRITFYMKPEKAVAEGGKGKRVNAILFPDEFDTKDKPEAGSEKQK